MKSHFDDRATKKAKRPARVQVTEMPKLTSHTADIRGEQHVRTSVALDKLGALVEGRHENPFELLGPHEVVDDGRRAAGRPGVSAAIAAKPGSSMRRMRHAADAANSSGRIVRSDLSPARNSRIESLYAANHRQQGSRNPRCTILMRFRRC